MVLPNSQQQQSNSSTNSEVLEPQEIQVSSPVNGSTVGPVDPDSDDDESEEVDPDVTDAGTDTEETEETTTEPQKFSSEDVEVFSEIFKDQFGVDVETAKQILQAAQQNASTSAVLPLAQAWNVDVAEANRRADMVLAHIDTLPQAEADKLKSEGTIEDVLRIYDQVAASRARNLFGRRSSPAASTPGGRSVKVFTEAEISSMSPAERRRRDSEILKAYQEGRVRE